MRSLIRLFLLWPLWVSVGAWAAEVRVAVAANFAAPMKQIGAAFEQQTGHRVLASVGSTGALFAQVVHGAPFQIFLSADDTTPRRLEAQGLAVAGTRRVVAVGRLVLWSPRADLVDAEGQVLRTGRFERLAVANPKLAPYGAAAREVMDRLGLEPHLRGRLVQGENIAQAHQFVASGNAALGFLALSQVMVDGRIGSGSAWLVPPHLHAPLRQEAVLLSRGETSTAARAFLAFLTSEASRAIIQAHGYGF